MAGEAKPEVEIKYGGDPKNQLFDAGFLFTPSDSFSLGHTVLPQYKTSLMTDDRQTTQCAKGATDSTVGQKSKDHFQGPGQIQVTIV